LCPLNELKGADLRPLAAEDDNTIALREKMTVFDAIYGISQAWSYMNPVTLVQSWRKILLHREE
jgi:hypothetical protein